MTVREPSQLSGLLASPFRRRDVDGIVIEDAMIDPSRRVVWEQRLNCLYFSCACGPAAIGLATGMLGVFTNVITYDGEWSGPHVLSAIGFVVGATVVGKLVGFGLVHRNLNVAVRAVQREWTGVRERPSREQGIQRDAKELLPRWPQRH